jgi:rhodanese-related sulfurtransferase
MVEIQETAMLLPASVATVPGPYWGLNEEQLGLYVGGGLVLLAGLIYVIHKLMQMPHESRAKLNPTMEPIQVAELMQGNPPIIVDLRTPEEFNGKLGHLRGAVNIPVKELKGRIDELRGTTGNRPIILVDDNDRVSHAVVAVMKYEGFEWYYVMKGGMRAWSKQRLPVYH